MSIKTNNQPPKIMYKNLWFTGRDSRRQLPAECIADCSGPSADQAVEFWLKRLEFDGPAWLIREYLEDFDVWDSTELCNHQANLGRVLWIWAGNCAEGHANCDYLHLGGDSL